MRLRRKGTQIKQVYVPVRCNLKMPLKPAANGSFEAHKELVRYFLRCEEIAKDCTRSE